MKINFNQCVLEAINELQDSDGSYISLLDHVVDFIVKTVELDDEKDCLCESFTHIKGLRELKNILTKIGKDESV